MNELTVDSLHLAYGTNPILKGVSMELRRGEVVALLGPSGSGKTTLLRSVAGLESPQQGTVRIGDRTVFDGAAGIDAPAEARNLGLVFQSYALWPHKTVFDNVAYGLKLRKVAPAEIRQRVDTALSQIGLGKLADRYPHQLSGGQQQRVALARALVYNPPVILLDEPLSNLDAKLREEARAWLRELIVTLGLSALCVTHDQTEAMAMADRILLLANGKIEQQGTPQEMYETPRTLFAAEFMGSNNRFPATVVERRNGHARIDVAGTPLWGKAVDDTAPADAAVAVARVEAVKVATGPGENRLPATLVTSMFLGDRREYLFHVGHATVRSFGDAALAPGDYWIEVPPERLWVFAQ